MTETTGDTRSPRKELNGAVTLRDLRYSFPGRVLWEGLDCTMAAGELTVVRGQSGSGKTTLLQCVGGLEEPERGEIVVAGLTVAELHGRARRSFRRHRVGFVFQTAGLIASWSVRRNLEIGGLRISAGRGRALSERTRAVCAQFLFPTEAIDAPACRLSGGEQQRVSLIRLALTQPDLLLLDEPSSALDDKNTDRLVEFIDAHRASGGSALIATHDARLVAHADNELVLH